MAFNRFEVVGKVEGTEGTLRFIAQIFRKPKKMATLSHRFRFFNPFALSIQLTRHQQVGCVPHYGAMTISVSTVTSHNINLRSTMKRPETVHGSSAERIEHEKNGLRFGSNLV